VAWLKPMSESAAGGKAAWAVGKRGTTTSELSNDRCREPRVSWMAEAVREGGNSEASECSCSSV